MIGEVVVSGVVSGQRESLVRADNEFQNRATFWTLRISANGR